MARALGLVLLALASIATGYVAFYGFLEARTLDFSQWLIVVIMASCCAGFITWFVKVLRRT